MKFTNSREIFYTCYPRFQRIIYKLPLELNHNVVYVKVNQYKELIVYTSPLIRNCDFDTAKVHTDCLSFIPNIDGWNRS